MELKGLQQVGQVAELETGDAEEAADEEGEAAFSFPFFGAGVLAAAAAAAGGADMSRLRGENTTEVDRVSMNQV